MTDSTAAQVRQYDVVIIGGGIVGLTLASQLVDTDFTVAVIEQQAQAGVGDETDSRVSAINPFALRHYADSGILGSPLAARIASFEHMQVWDSTGAGRISFHAAELGIPRLGAIIENQVLQTMLMQHISDAPNISVYCPATVCSIQYEAIEGRASRVSIGLAQVGGQDDVQDDVRDDAEGDGDQQLIEAKLLVGADGIESKVREAAMIPRHRSSYEQFGVVCNISTTEPHQDTAWQCFMPSGPLALLPLFDGGCSIVWTLDKARADDILSLDDPAFCSALADASQYCLGEVLSATSRRAFPLTHGHVDDYIKPGLALVGDAAHNIHPLAGQGANLGIADAVALAGVIQQARANGRRWYSSNTLGRYQRQRKGANQLMESAMTGFKMLFGEDSGLVSEVRNAGLFMVDSIPLLKNQMIRVALGN